MFHSKRYLFSSLNENMYEKFKNATYFYPIMIENGIAPKFISYSLVKNGDRYIGEIVTEKLIDVTNPVYKQILNEHYDSIVDLFNEKIDKMHELGIAHGDMFSGNIVFKTSPRLDVFIIDFDDAFYIDSGEEEERVQELWLNSYPDKTYEEYHKNLYDKIEKRRKFALQFAKEFQNDDSAAYRRIKEERPGLLKWPFASDRLSLALSIWYDGFGDREREKYAELLSK